MSPLFADYEPEVAGTTAGVAVQPMSQANLDECVALAVKREGGDEARWRTSLGRSLKAEDRMTFVALLDGEVAGYGTAGWFSPASVDPDSSIPEGWYLLGLVVAPQARRLGIGRQLTAARLAWLKNRTRRVWYFASSANRASIDLHTGLGFRMTASNVSVPGVAFTDSGQLYVADLSSSTPAS